MRRKQRLSIKPWLWILAFWVLFHAGCQTTPGSRSGSDSAGHGPHDKTGGRASYIDAHNHLVGSRPGPGTGNGFPGAVRTATQKMDRLGIQKMIVMPPPLSPDHPVTISLDDLCAALKKYPGRFAWLGGGESLNIMIHKAAKKKTVDSSLKRQFREKALKILKKGAVGFGEFALEHFSFNHDHPYESVPADHPLFLLLADIAAEHGVPVDVHMEAVPRDTPLPQRGILLRSGRNPDMLQENIPAFERLLRHNRRAKIIWSHVGWCNTGYRTTELCEKLLKRHPNLYMSFKLSRESVPETRPLSEDKSRIKTAWLGLMQAFPDRFVIGTDQFYTPPGGRTIGPQKTEDTKLFMTLLPPDLARSIGIENPRRIFGLKP